VDKRQETGQNDVEFEDDQVVHEVNQKPIRLDRKARKNRF
jgi:hypothetical protein